MTPRRVFLISKNFWPVSGETELLAAAFSKQLAELVDQVDILTWRMIRQWPDRFQFGKCQVIRLPQSHRTSWSPAALGYYGRNRWHRSLQRWITSEGKHYDAGFVFEFASDALAPSAIAGKSGIPIISRVHQKLLAGLTRNVTRDIRQLKGRAAVFVTPDQSALMDPLAAPEGPLSELVYVSDGQPPRQELLPARLEAREILGRVHPIFKLNDDALLVICGADLTFESGVFSLVRAWRRVLADQPSARLWLIGTGRNAPEIFQRICDLDMQHSVLLTGNFDDVSDILAAADAYIMPGTEPPGWYAHVASQFGLTIIHHRNCETTESAYRSTTIPFDDDSRTIDLVLSRWANSRQSTATYDPASIRERSGPATSIAEMVSQYLSLIQRQQQSIS